MRASTRACVFYVSVQMSKPATRYLPVEGNSSSPELPLTAKWASAAYGSVNGGYGVGCGLHGVERGSGTQDDALSAQYRSRPAAQASEKPGSVSASLQASGISSSRPGRLAPLPSAQGGLPPRRTTKITVYPSKFQKQRVPQPSFTLTPRTTAK